MPKLGGLARSLRRVGLGGSELRVADPLRDGVQLQRSPRLRIVPAQTADRAAGSYPRLEWQGPLEAHLVGPIELQDCLSRFIRLRGRSLEEIEMFASQWGVLGICDEHGQPCPPYAHTCTLSSYEGPFPRGWPDGKGSVYWEPLWAWWRYADQIRAILKTVVALEGVDRPTADVWKTVAESINACSHGSGDGHRRFGSLLIRPGLKASQRRECVAFLLSEWLENAGVRPQILWRGGAPEAKLSLGGPSSLPSILALQLATVVTSPFGVWQCDGCGDLYTEVAKRPAIGRMHFCPQCRQGGRASKRAWYRRNRAKQIASGERSP